MVGKCRRPTVGPASWNDRRIRRGGTNFGVAPEATIIPVARISPTATVENAFADAALRSAITLLPSADRRRLDDLLAGAYREDYAKFDIINRSYGIRFSIPP